MALGEGLGVPRRGHVRIAGGTSKGDKAMGCGEPAGQGTPLAYGRVSHEILAELPEHHQRLIEIIGQPWASSRRWPKYDYIDRRFRREVSDLLDPERTARGATSRGPGGYPMIFAEDDQSWGNPPSRMGLTVPRACGK